MDSVLAPAGLPLAPSRSSVLTNTLEGSALICLLLGESVGGLLPPAWSVLWFSPVFLAGWCLLAARYVLWPAPGLLARAWDRAQIAFAHPEIRRTWMVGIGSRLVVLAI